MIIDNAIKFDNTLSVQRLAQQVEKSGLLDKTLMGNQTQQFNIGDVVEGNGFTNAIIVNTWNTNGFQYYECEITNGKKKHIFRERQQDLTLLSRSGGNTDEP